MNIKTLLENYGTGDIWKGLEYTGVDASLVISLMEYGLVWSTPDADGEVRFIYRTYTESVDDEFIHTDWISINPEIDFEKEWNFINWDFFCDCIGSDFDEWSGFPFGMKVYDLVNRYGYKSIFGSSYYPRETPRLED